LSLGIESRDPDIPSCWHSCHYAPQLSLVKWVLLKLAHYMAALSARSCVEVIGWV
jgi:hypothetical protein